MTHRDQCESLKSQQLPIGGQNEKINQRDEYQNNGFLAEVIQTTVKYSEDEIFPHLMCEPDSD